MDIFIEPLQMCSPPKVTAVLVCCALPLLWGWQSMLGALLSLIFLLPAGISPVSHNVLMHFLPVIGAVQITLKYLFLKTVQV